MQSFKQWSIVETIRFINQTADLEYIRSRLPGQLMKKQERKEKQQSQFNFGFGQIWG